MIVLKPCLVCGEPSESSRCPEHVLPSSPKQNTTERGYGWTWQKLSERARRMQPFCSDCFATADLTTDHSEQAWRRVAEGKPIRLRDVEVVCRSCNARRGRARPRGDAPPVGSADPRRQAESASHTPGGIR